MEKNKYDEAVEKIEEIIRDLINSHNHPAPPEFLTDWILIAAAHVEEPEAGESGTSYRRMSRNDQPPHVTLGLLEYEVTKLRHFLVTEEVE